MNKVTDILSFIVKHDVKFLKVSIIDILGQKRSVEFPLSAFSDISHNRIMCDSSSILGGSENADSDKQIALDKSSAFLNSDGVLEIFGSLVEEDGLYTETDTRAVLKKQTDILASRGYILNVGLEPEFYFLDEETLDPIDDGTYFELNANDRCGELRKECVKALAAEGYIIGPFHHEVGPGQNEINFAYNEALYSADRLFRYKEIIKEIAGENGVIATFYPKPFIDLPGSGMHLNCSLCSLKGRNLFFDPSVANNISALAHQFISGVLFHSRALTSLSCTIDNSYKRLHSGIEAPGGIYWSYKDRSAAVRIPQATEEKTRIELRYVDNTAQIYLLLAGIIASGMDGIDHPLQNYDDRSSAEELPKSLTEALDCLKEDEVINAAFGEKIIDKYVKCSQKLAKISERRAFIKY